MKRQDRTGQDRTGQDRTGQDRTGQDRTGQDRTGQGRAGQGRAGQGRTEKASRHHNRSLCTQKQARVGLGLEQLLPLQAHTQTALRCPLGK